ncbi:MAG: hypothetical protein C0618_06715 [Desulfuromonas sp.]|nr:MAG: hypothetical protein C0618_06715 [Desulfuromonas sp.]
MSPTLILIALTGGMCTGVLVLLTVESLLSIISALHGALMTRWKKLTNAASPGQIKTGILVRLLLNKTVLFIIAITVSDGAHGYFQPLLRAEHTSTPDLIYKITALFTAVLCGRIAIQRLRLSWMLSHQVGYAEKRQRTFLLR